MMKVLFVLIAGIPAISLQAQAKKADDAQIRESLLKIVPEAKVVRQDGHEYKLTTVKQTLMEVEFNRDGSIDDASGDAAAAGDVFVPGNGMLTLAQALESLNKAGKTPSGDWSYKKSFMHGWVYELEGFENGKKMEYLISAKDGALVKEKKD
ncbi:PepSY domain-containing protein [Bdellovibrio sp. HCB209]|uniref:PepSY domain-containing protein n=1 Tax=Bdellovibrio sp. HCB209 TaxID=3394354 RepID=UPI0039B4ABBA